MQVIQDRCESISELKGALDINTVEEVREILLAYLKQSATIVVDLSSVTSCDAAGVQLLFALAKSAELAGKSLIVASTSEALVRDCANLGINIARWMATDVWTGEIGDGGARESAQGAKNQSTKLPGEMCNA